MKDLLHGFALGFALYPWRGGPSDAFDGWSGARCTGYRAGLLCVLIALFSLGAFLTRGT